MIRVTGINGREFVINADLIEQLESVPETVITLTSNKKLLVKESIEEIVARAIAYRRRIVGGSEAGE